MTRIRTLLIAEAANPEWVSVPLVGWSHARALTELTDAHVVTQVRNREAIERYGWREGREFTSIDSEAVAKPLFALGSWLRKKTGLGWTTTTALSSLAYYLFEQRLWERFGPRIERGEFDVVHRLTPLTPTAPSLIARRCAKVGVPFVWGPINGGVPWPKQFAEVQRKEGEWLSYVRSSYRLLPAVRSTREHARALIVGSRATLDELSEYREKCVYIPENAIDLARFGSIATPPQQGPLKAVFVGRLVPYKGADMLIEAAVPLLRAGKLELSILGDGPEKAALERRVREASVEGRVSLPGWVAHEKVQDLLREHHVFAFPSVREFGGGVVLEAMALGVVPIVVDYAGPAELVTDATGFRVPLGSRAEVVARLREVLARLCDDRSGLPAIAERARARVRTHFTWEAKARQVLKVYDWVLGRAPKPDFGTPFPDQPEEAPSEAAGF